MFGFVYCNASIIARQNTDPHLFFVRSLVKNWLWPIITFFGVTGNILAIIVLTKRRMIMSSTNNYLVALAIVDIAYLLLTLILNTLQNPCFVGTSLSEIMLTICRPIADFSSNTSVWLTVTFTVERWVAITYPLQSRTWCTINRARKIILSVLFASLICTLPSAFEMKLVRIIEKKNFSNEIIFTSYIKAKPTILGNSLLYHQIYFNFVTFAIIWIPLLLLVIFNTILIYYVHRSKQNKQQNSEGIELRRHNRGQQSEQRKTTIMLIAVVLVFTVCQIPQAISLTLQSFFPTLAQTSKVLIYNNFANCLVALNASMNFLLYCYFSKRFRLTFQSNFTFASKYCVNCIQPQCKIKTNHHHHHQTQHSTSMDNFSTYSLHAHQLNTHTSNLGIDTNLKYSTLTNQNFDRNKQTWFNRLSKFKLNHFQPTTKSNILPNTNQILKFSNSETLLINSTTTKNLYNLNGSNFKSRFYPKSHSYSENIKKNEQIWIKHHQSHSKSEEFLNRKQSYNWEDIIDETV